MQEVRVDGTQGNGQELDAVKLKEMLADPNVSNIIAARVPEVDDEVCIRGLVYRVVKRKMNTKMVSLLLELK